MTHAKDLSTGPSTLRTDRVGLAIIRSDYAPKFTSSNNARNENVHN